MPWEHKSSLSFAIASSLKNLTKTDLRRTKHWQNERLFQNLCFLRKSYGSIKLGSLRLNMIKLAPHLTKMMEYFMLRLSSFCAVRQRRERRSKLCEFRFLRLFFFNLYSFCTRVLKSQFCCFLELSLLFFFRKNAHINCPTIEEAIWCVVSLVNQLIPLSSKLGRKLAKGCQLLCLIYIRLQPTQGRLRWLCVQELTRNLPLLPVSQAHCIRNTLLC